MLRWALAFLALAVLGFLAGLGGDPLEGRTQIGHALAVFGVVAFAVIAVARHMLRRFELR